jgi:phage baseplate assembly protein gpV
MAITKIKPFNIDSTRNYTLSNLAVTSNVTTGNLKTDNLLYSNGSPYIFTTNAAGSNTQIQFNDGNSFAGSANLTFNKTTNTLSVTNSTITNNLTVSSGNLFLETAALSVDGNQAGIFTTTIVDLNIGLVSNIVMGSTTGNTTVRGNLIANSIINSGTLTANEGTITNLKINDFYSNRTPITVTSNTVIDTFPINKYRSAKYTIRVNSDDGYQAIEVLLIHNNLASFVTVYGSLSTIGTEIVTLSTDLNSGNVRLLATTVASNTTVNLLGTYVV